MNYQACEGEKTAVYLWYMRIFKPSITDAAEREQRVTAHYAEPRGGKALLEGLTQ